MGRRTARQDGTAMDKRRRRVPTFLVCRTEDTHRPNRRMVHPTGHRPRRQGDADTQAPLRVLALHAGPAQDWCHSHTRHPYAHPPRHCVPQHSGRHQGHSMRGRGICDEAGERRHGRQPHRRDTRERGPATGRRLPRLAARMAGSTRIRTPRKRQRQRRHHADVLHQRHERRTEDGGPRLPVCFGPSDNRSVLAQPHTRQHPPHRGRHRMGQGCLGKALRTVVCRSDGVRVRPREVYSRQTAAADREIPHHIVLRPAHGLPLHDTRRLLALRPVVTALLHHRRRSTQSRRIR